MQNRQQAATPVIQSTSSRGITALVLMCSLLLMGIATRAQTCILGNRYTFEAQRTSLYEALNIVSQKTGYFFIYDSKILLSDKRVKLEARGETLENILNELLNDRSLGFRVLSKHILIFKKSGNEVVRIREGSRPDSTSVISIRGTISDEQSRKPLPYVSVAIEGTSIGTITNGEGQFLVKMPQGNETKNIRVSHIGYKPYLLPIALTREQKVDIYLTPDVVSLQEIIIRRIDPTEIITKAIQNRKVSYPSNPFYLTSFYREGVLKNGKYLNYAEAIFKVYKPALDQLLGVDQVKEIKSRKVSNVEQADTLLMKLKGGVSACLSLDIVKSLPGFLDASEMERYRYTLSDIVSYESRNAYAIGFVQNPEVTEPLYTGTIYIDTDSLAILGAEFEINPTYIAKAGDQLITQTRRTHIVKPERFAYSVTYRKVGDRYYMAHAKCDIQLKARKKGRLFSSTFTAFLEMATCDIDTKNVLKFDRHETIRPQVVFLDVPYRYDPDFWGEFNFIVPEEKLSEALKRINTKIEKVE